MEAITEYLEKLVLHSGYKLCPGLRKYPEEVRFETKNVKRVDSELCMLWHVPNNTHHPTGDELRDVCQPCRLLQHDISRLVMKATSTSVGRKIGRKSIHSNYPLKYLSPASKAVCV